MISLIIALVLAALLWHGFKVERSLDQALKIAKKIKAAIGNGDKTIIMWDLEPWLLAKLLRDGFTVTRDGNFWVIGW